MIGPEVILDALSEAAFTSNVPFAVPIPVAAFRLTVPPITSSVLSLALSLIVPLDSSATSAVPASTRPTGRLPMLSINILPLLVSAFKAVPAVTSRNAAPVPIVSLAVVVIRLIVAAAISALLSSANVRISPVDSSVTLPVPALIKPTITLPIESINILLSSPVTVSAFNAVEAATSITVSTPIPPTAAVRLTVPPSTSATASSVAPSISPAEVTFTLPVPASTSPMVISPLVVVVRSIRLFVPVCTSVAVSAAPATSTSIEPLAASTSVRVVAVAASSSTLPAVLA